MTTSRQSHLSNEQQVRTGGCPGNPNQAWSSTPGDLNPNHWSVLTPASKILVSPTTLCIRLQEVT